LVGGFVSLTSTDSKDLICPKDLDLKSSIDWIGRLDKLPGSRQYDLNFEQLDFVKPFGALFVPMQIRRIEESKDISFEFCNLNLEYAKGIGFLNLLTMRNHYEPSYFRGGSSYLPISEIKLIDLYEKSESGTEYGKLADDESKRLAGILFSNDSNNAKEQFAYSLREVMRNVFEHAKVSNLFCCGQRYPQRGVAEICIADLGQGVLNGLKENRKYLDLSSDIEALKEAVKPGVSGKEGCGMGGDWDNSGYGLYMNYKLGGNNGYFVIASGCGLFASVEGKDLTGGIPYLKGTIVSLLVNLQSKLPLNEQLAQFSREAQDVFDKENPGKRVIISPSSMNKI
jgi:hypothetical protein